MLADIQVTLHAMALQDMWGKHVLDNDGIKVNPRIVPDQVHLVNGYSCVRGCNQISFRYPKHNLANTVSNKPTGNVLVI